MKPLTAGLAVALILASGAGRTSGQTAPTPSLITLQSLEASFPEKLATFAALGEMREMNVGMVGARRQYLDGKRQLTVDIVDGSSSAPMLTALRGLLGSRQGVNETSSETVRKIVTVGKFPALLEWRKAQNASQLQILIDDRFILRLSVFSASSPEEALTIAKSLNLK